MEERYLSHRDKLLAGFYLSISALFLLSIPLALERSSTLISAAVSLGTSANAGLLLQQWAYFYLPPAACLFALSGISVLRNWAFRRQAQTAALVFTCAPLPLFALAWFSV